MIDGAAQVIAAGNQYLDGLPVEGDLDYVTQIAKEQAVAERQEAVMAGYMDGVKKEVGFKANGKVLKAAE